jgi:biopolymer transport protein TolQ
MAYILYSPAVDVSNGDFVYMIRNASPISKLALLLLLVFSVVSWAIIIFKFLEYSRARKNSQKFLEVFRKTRNFSDIAKVNSLFVNNPLGEIFKGGYKELALQMGPNFTPDQLRVESLNRAMLRVSQVEIVRFERLNGFLATTAAVAPFIGLFGTVWGIMKSFQSIGVQMNANLVTVAPGIAEALVATAMGLFAAIPAVIFYNYLLNKLRVLIAMMEGFIMEFLNACERLR